MTEANVAVRVVGQPPWPAGGPPLVRPMPTGYYLVQVPGPSRSIHHLVRKDRNCACPLGPACPAVEHVAGYLRQGGQRAPDVKPNSLIPPICPICGGPVHFEPALCSLIRGAGWVCLNSARSETMVWPDRYWHPGERHYWQYLWNELGRLRFGSRP